MPDPAPLTATPAPDLDWSRAGTPASHNFDDVYYSVDSGVEETEAVFLRGIHAPECWQGNDRFAIGELGFGTGLNFLTTCQMWAQNAPKGARLHFVSVEKYPLGRDALQKALAPWERLKPWSDRLLDVWPGRVRGIHRRHFGNITLTLVHDDVRAALADMSGQVDAWFLDGFSPAKNPDMWSENVMMQIARLSAPGARAATFSVAGPVREALTKAGFTVSKQDGFGRKRHRLEAVLNSADTQNAVLRTDTIKPIIIGAGISGASLARSFSMRAITPIMIDPDDGTAGSGNAAAIIKPRIDLQDRPESRFYLSSYLYAVQSYDAAGAVIHQGIRHRAKSDDETVRYARFHDQGALPEPHVMPRKDGVYFGKAVVVDPARIRTVWTEEAKRVTARAHRFVKTDQGWDVYDAKKSVIAQGTHIIIAAGFGIKTLGLGDGSISGHRESLGEMLELRYSRGQLTWAEGVDGFDAPLTYGGYGIPINGKALVGTTHARVTMDDPFSPTVKDDESNLSRLSAQLGSKIDPANIPSRASVRVNTKQTTPLVDRLAPDLFVMTGLGSRGFVFAPLLAEDVVSQICADPGATALSARARFQAREMPNQKARPHINDATG